MNEIGGYKIIFHSKIYDSRSRGDGYYSRLIVMNENDLFLIQEEFEKINDIIKMPIYISKDWVHYNKSELLISDIDSLLKRPFRSDTASYGLLTQEEKDLLLSIRRELQLKSIAKPN